MVKFVIPLVHVKDHNRIAMDEIKWHNKHGMQGGYRYYLHAWCSYTGRKIIAMSIYVTKESIEYLRMLQLSVLMTNRLTYLDEGI